MISRAAPLLFAAAVAAAIAWGMLRPAYNWDLIGYTGAALDDGHTDAAALQRSTYALAGKELSPTAYALLTDAAQGSEAAASYRRRAATDPIFFRNQLAFYSVRPLYVGLLRLLMAAGLNPLEGTLLLSAIGVLLAAAALWKWTAPMRENPLRLPACLLLLPATGLTELAGLSTPDALAAGAAFGTLYLIVERGVPIAALLPAILLRTDMLVLLLVTAIWLRWFAPAERRISHGVFLVTVPAGFLLYAAVTFFFGTHDIRSLLPVAMIGRPGGAEFPGSFADILTGYLGALRGSVTSAFGGYSAYPMFLLLGLLAAARSGLQAAQKELGTLAVSGMILRFFLFPLLANRFFTAYFLLAAVAFLIRDGAEYSHSRKV